MKKTRALNLISLIFNLLIVVFTIHGVSECFRTDVIRDENWFGSSGWECFKFFTVLSNVFVAIVAFIVFNYSIKNIINDELKMPKWVFMLKFVATTAVTVTFMTVVFFLGPYVVVLGKSYFSMFTGNNFFMHLLTPLLAIFSFIFCERTDNFSFKNTWLGLVPVVLYGIVYTIMVVFVGEANGGWKDFYGFTFGGNMWAIPISLVVMLGATFGFACLLWFCQKKNVEKQKI